ncbi:MAG: ABC transporter substrate-binding protein [Clostridia bacterium]|nr:ABC transporter substrate-binding protein [Clostridia bacterium]
MKKVIALLLVLVMSAMCFTACSDSKTESSSESAAESSVAESSEESTEAESSEESAEATETAEFTTVAEGVLTMATNVAFPPYEFYDGETPTGIDVEIATAVAEKLGLTLEVVDMDFGSIITSVQQGKADCGFAGMTVNEERLQNVNFTSTYSTGVQVIIVKEGSDIATADDLANAELIGVQEATTGHIYCADDFGEDHVVAYNNGATAVQSLVNDKVDCVVIDKQPALNFVEANEGLKILDTEYVLEDYAACVSKDNEALLKAMNTALDELTADGTIQAILDKYIK